MTDTETPNAQRLHQLPNSEWNAIVYLARGYSVERMAKEIGVHPSTVKQALAALRLKLDVRTSAEIPYAYYLATARNPFDMKLRTKEDT
jgi:DNA-binding NarL/FixJ family response regulator